MSSVSRNTLLILISSPHGISGFHSLSCSHIHISGKDANYTDPFRLFNVDICEYEIDNPMALYGSIPMITAHGEAGSVAIFWNNEAETWVDIEREDTVRHSLYICYVN